MALFGAPARSPKALPLPDGHRSAHNGNSKTFLIEKRSEGAHRVRTQHDHLVKEAVIRGSDQIGTAIVLVSIKISAAMPLGCHLSVRVVAHSLRLISARLCFLDLHNLSNCKNCIDMQLHPASDIGTCSPSGTFLWD